MNAPSPLIARLIIFVPVLLFATLAIREATKNKMVDLYIYRGGSTLGLHGESPYDVTRIRTLVSAQIPDDQKLIDNCGFFLPPLAIVVLAPFAAMPWLAAKLLYGFLCQMAGLACWWYARGMFGSSPILVSGEASDGLTATPPETWAGEKHDDSLPFLFIPALVLLHPVAIITMIVGQTPMLMAGAIAVGQYAFERKRPVLGSLLWATAFIKPHLALVLLPLAWYLGGWTRAFAVAIWVGILNLAGCLLAGGSPLFLFDYLDYLASGHKAVEFNRVALNWQIVSWNRMVVSVGGPAWDLSLSETLAGYGVAGGLIVGRCRLRLAGPETTGGGNAKIKPSHAWAMAIAVSASLVCCQVLAYELYLLVLTLPFILELIAHRRKLDAGILIALLLAQILPFEFMRDHDLGSYRPWLTMAVFLWLLARPTWTTVPVLPSPTLTNRPMTD